MNEILPTQDSCAGENEYGFINCLSIKEVLDHSFVAISSSHMWCNLSIYVFIRVSPLSIKEDLDHLFVALA